VIILIKVLWFGQVLKTSLKTQEYLNR